MNFRQFDHMITTRPHDIHGVFISDLHLDGGSGTDADISHHPHHTYQDSLAQQPLITAFLSLLEDLSALPNLKTLYILGDWFEVWIGDDAYLNLDKTQQPSHWITPIVNKLKQMRINGCRTIVIVGNRDFLMRQPFCNTFAGELVEEPYFIKIGHQTARLEHGDALCTDDKDYQKFRKYARKPLVQWWFLHKSLAKRESIAHKLRKKSKQATASKDNQIMDVNATAVRYALNPNLDLNLVKQCQKKRWAIPPSSELLIHGHTHRPACHQLTDPENEQQLKYRYVLGDWRVHNFGESHEHVTAVIGILSCDTAPLFSENDNHPQCVDKLELVEYQCKTG